MHALIIEDEMLIALSVESALMEFGYITADIAVSMTQAIAAAEHQCPDLIVADHRIVDGTGTAAVQAICSHNAIPVVFVTGSGREVLELLPDALIVPKPFCQSGLQAAINAALERPYRYLAD